MDDPSIRRAGSVASFGVAVAYLLTGVSAVLMPSELQGRPEITPHEFWTVLSQDPTAHLAYHWAWVLAGLSGIVAVPAISLLVWSVHPGATLGSGLAAFLGFGVMARSHLMEIAFDRKIIPVYLGADPAFQQAVHVVAGLALDVPDGVLTYGAVGVWIAVVGRLALRQRALPRGFAYLGFATATSRQVVRVSGVRLSRGASQQGNSRRFAGFWACGPAASKRRRAGAPPADAPSADRLCRRFGRFGFARVSAA